MTRPKARLLLAFLLVYVLWGSTYLAIRIAIGSLPPLVMGSIRFLIAGTAMWTWARLTTRATASRAEWRGGLIVGTLLLFGGNGAVIWSEQRVPSGIAALLVAVVPLWMVLLDWARPGGARPRTAVFVGLALGLGGLALLVGPGAFGGGGVDPLGAGVLMLGSLSWAFGSLYSKKAPRASSPILNAGIQMLGGGTALAIASVASGEIAQLHPAAITLQSALAVGYLVVFGSLIGFTAYLYLLAHTTPAKASTYAYVNPVVAVFLGWAIAGEPVTARMLTAAAVILTSVALISLRGGAGKARSAPAEPPGAAPRRAA